VPCGGSSDGGGPAAAASGKADGVETEQLAMRLESLQQENRVLRMELETMRYRCKALEQENKDLKRARVNIVRYLGHFPSSLGVWIKVIRVAVKIRDM